MGKIAEKTRKIDMYASLPALSFGKDGKVYSRLGSLLTFLTIVIVGGMAIWIGISIFGRHKPSFVQYELPAKVQNPKLQFNTDDFKFGILLSSYTGQTLDWTTLVSKTATFGQNSVTIPLTTNKCTFDFMPGYDFDCYAQSSSTKGKTYLDTMGSDYFVIDYDYCSGSGSCETQANAKTTLQNAQAIYLFGYNDLLIDPFNYENPITVTESYDQDFLLLNVGRTLVVTLNEIEFTSDNGWLFEDLKTETRLKATVASKVSNSNIFSIHIIYGGNKTVYKRTYPKIQDFLAQVSGFITIITPIFLILVGPYVGLRAVQQMVNEIYEIKLNKTDNNSGDSPQKPSAKKKRRSSKSKSGSSSPTSALQTEAALVPQKASGNSKKKANLPRIHAKNPSNIPHAALDIKPAEEIQTKEDILPTPQASSKLSPKEDDYDNLISPEKPAQGELISHAKASQQERPEDLEAKQDHINDQNPAEEGFESEEEDIPLRSSDTLEVPWQDWLRSLWKPNPQVQMLNKAKEHLMETLDLLTLSKKVVEIDKLKACLLTHDERVIFENLPSSVIVLDPTADLKSDEAIQQYHWKESFKGDEAALRKAYSNLKGTQKKLGQRLIKLYESEYLEDEDAMVRQEDSH